MMVNMKRFYLLRYRLRNGDTNLKIKINTMAFLFCLLLIIPLFMFFKPLSQFKNNLNNNKEVMLSSNNMSLNANNQNIEQYFLPISGTITSYYGYRKDPITLKNSKHTGIDISGIHHDNVRVIADGIVTFAGVQNGYGNCIEIKHNSSNNTSYYSFYAHLSQIKVTKNENVKKGQVIAIEGGDPKTDPNPGYSTGHHLHFEIRKDSGYGNDINPLSFYESQNFSL